jgi:hypothetical protein
MERSADAAGTARRLSHATRGGTRREAPPRRGRWLLRAACLLLAAMLPGSVRAAPVLYTSNGHYYEAVSRSGGLT